MTNSYEQSVAKEYESDGIEIRWREHMIMIWMSCSDGGKTFTKSLLYYTASVSVSSDA